jgi:hypothetical protein
VTALADQAEDRRGLGRVTQIVEEQPRGLFIEDPERAQDQRPQGRRKVRMIAGQLPVAWDTAPDGVGFHRLDGVGQGKGALNPTGPEGSDLEDFPSTAEQRRRAIQRQALHQPLRGAREEQMEAPLRVPIDVSLQHARKLAGDGGQGRKLVEDQRRPRAGFVPEAGTERVPIGIGHPVELGEEPGDLRGQARSLK